MPARYRRVVEEVVVRPEVLRYEIEPAVYEEEEVTLVVEEARGSIEPCETSGTRFSRGVGVMAFCASEVPAKTRTVSRKTLVSPERTRVVIEPAQTRKIERWVVAEPARAVRVEVLPETEEVEVQNLASAESFRLEEVPAVTEAMRVTRYEGKPRIVSRRVVCDADLTRDFVTQVQRGLFDRGYYPGRIDGLVGSRTIEALTAFQVDEGLAVGALTYESLRELDLEVDRSPAP
ncbi:peptidoglycan-binding protein [Marinobacterium aestuariivivens]|uniref:Peptidoglycan-binding protein n=1 Tax=Marinobacterium aestuariivivens TaxID=1698799 RepID=A0ABW1ZY07_9GAMM